MAWSAWLLPAVLVVLALTARGVEAQPPVLAVQTALILFAARQQTWTSPTTVRAAAQLHLT